MGVNWKHFGIVLLFLWFFVLQSQFYYLPSSSLQVNFLDIGQGDSIFIKTPNNRTMLIDGGPGVTVLEKLGESTSFWRNQIDIMVLSHPDLDHLEGLVEAIPRYQIKAILITGLQHSSRLYQEFLERVERWNIPVYLAHAQKDWILDNGVVFDVLWPNTSYALQKSDSPNDTSIAGILRYGNCSIFLSGDIEQEAEESLLKTGFDLKSQVYKAGHHGSRSSSTQKLLNHVNPDSIVISSGRENPFNHPHLDVVTRFDEAQISWINTKDLGNIRLSCDGNRWTFSSQFTTQADTGGLEALWAKKN